MPKRLKPYADVQAAAHSESFEPYWTSILVIVMGSFTLFGLQSVAFATQAVGVKEVSSCFMQSNESAYNRFQTCTRVN